MRLLPILAACLIPFAAGASPLLPERLLQTIKADPASYIESVATLIAAHGTGDGITQDQLDASVALSRAKARTAAEVPLMKADLDGDGAVTRDEMTLAEAAASAVGRARLEKIFLVADADGDAIVSAAERGGYGADAALAAFGPGEMARMKVLMGFDADGDGRVTVNEVRQALEGLVS